MNQVFSVDISLLSADSWRNEQQANVGGWSSEGNELQPQVIINNERLLQDLDSAATAETKLVDYRVVSCPNRSDLLIGKNDRDPCMPAIAGSPVIMPEYERFDKSCDAETTGLSTAEEAGWDSGITMEIPASPSYRYDENGSDYTKQVFLPIQGIGDDLRNESSNSPEIQATDYLIKPVKRPVPESEPEAKNVDEKQINTQSQSCEEKPAGKVILRDLRARYSINGDGNKKLLGLQGEEKNKKSAKEPRISQPKKLSSLQSHAPILHLEECTEQQFTDMESANFRRLCSELNADKAQNLKDIRRKNRNRMSASKSRERQKLQEKFLNKRNAELEEENASLKKQLAEKEELIAQLLQQNQPS